MIVGVSDVTHIRVHSNSIDTPRKVIGLKDLSGLEMKLVLWGNRANEFDAKEVHLLGEETLSGGLACKWYLNEDIVEIDEFFERYRLCLICSDGTTAAEFVLFGRVAQQVVGKTVMSLMENDRIPREIAAIVSQKFIFAVSVSQKSLTQRVVSFQVNGVESFCGRQACTLDIRDYDDVEATKASSFLAMLTPLSNLLHLLGY
uniref:Replication protein A OB domain-containing protein n=1 Tax=Setaria italica TaxID=4555 RepID=K3ZNA1_SETIT